MSARITLSGLILCLLICSPLVAQTHSSVPLDSQVYYILEQAELRGLCSPLSGIRPYTRSVVVNAINEILSFENRNSLRGSEREILENYLSLFAKPDPGFDISRGGFFSEITLGAKESPFSFNIGAIADIQGSMGIYPGNNYFGTEIWLGLYINGDLGRNVSYDFTIQGGLMQSPHRFLGQYNTYYAGYSHEHGDQQYENRVIDVYSNPLTHFPYDYRKRWDGSVYFFGALHSYDSWPSELAAGYSLPAELTASFLDNRLITRIGRIQHDWGSTVQGSSLSLNQAARPFIAFEAEFFPVPWFNIATITGFLEYYNADGIYESPKTFQSMYSANMLQFRLKNYLYFDIVDIAVYPKRFELGYISPITSNFFYQNNSGKFDNMALNINLRAQYPGLGYIWLSAFIDEMILTQNILSLDRQMYAIQAGANVALPFLSFSSIKLMYTKINPYTYTHHRNIVPWYGDNLMEKSYTNNGVGLGYYLPPNSDELLVRFQTMPVPSLNLHFQYQLIHHGADYGSSAVDGSNLLSELDPLDRDNKPVLKRWFLRDGAYQWNHIFRIGGEWNLPKVPITLYGSAGVNLSYFTNIAEEANVTGEPHNWSIIDTPEYPKSTGFILELGIKIFPRY